MKALIDGDILGYECGFGAELLEDPSWDGAKYLLEKKIDLIVEEAEADSYQLFLSSPGSFRHEASDKYKGNRPEKPHYHPSLYQYMIHELGAWVSHADLEADDEMAMYQTQGPDQHPSSYRQLEETIICSRDKDLMQVPGWFYRWESWNKGSYGPTWHTSEGVLELVEHETPSGKIKTNLEGHGYAFFIAQCLLGDRTDGYSGCNGVGTKKGFSLLKDLYTPAEMEHAAMERFPSRQEFEETARLAWLVRRREGDQFQIWREGLYD